MRRTGLKVAGRTSSFAFKDQNQDLRKIGEALGVANILEGSVRKSGNTVRITAQLIDAADGKRKWVYQRSTPSLSLRSNVGVTVAGKAALAGFPGGKLVAIALNNGEAVRERIRSIIAENVPTFEAFFGNWSAYFEWERPSGGCVCCCCRCCGCWRRPSCSGCSR